MIENSYKLMEYKYNFINSLIKLLSIDFEAIYLRNIEYWIKMFSKQL